MLALQKYCKILFRKIGPLAARTVKNFGVKEVHQLRVEIKKLKALINMLVFYREGPGKELLNKLTNSFRGSGSIRDLQVLKKVLAKFPDADERVKKEILVLVTKHEKSAHKKFKKHFEKSGKQMLHSLRKELLAATDRLNQFDFRLYYNLMIQIITQKIRRTDLTEEDYHRLRMDLKELKYNLKLLKEEDKLTLQELPDEKKLHSLELMLGDWHDQVMIIEWIDKFAALSHVSGAAAQYLQKLKSATKSEGKRLLADAQEVLRHHEIVVG